MAKTYNISKGNAYTAGAHVINDSIGRVCYVLKSNSKILLENLSDSQNKALKTPENEKSITVGSGAPTVDCFYNYLSKKSVYSETIPETVTSKTDNKTKKIITTKTVTEPTIKAYKIKLAENIFTLEIRNNDPWILTGLDIAPLDIFKTIAITKAEVDTIKGKVTENALNSTSLFFNIGTPETVQVSGSRKYYKANLSLSGSKKGTTGNTPLTVATDVFVYSLDKNNWVSVAYANAAFNKISGNVWDNQTIPNPVIGTNPFAAYWSNGNTGLKDRLTTIIATANNLPASGDNKGYRLLDSPIRDYLYQGDIDKVTFEMAFRLPFYIENIKETPYTTVNGRFNNPYYTKFDDWFGYANGLRTLAGYNLGKLLSRTGHMQSFTDAINLDQGNSKLYAIAGVQKNDTLAKYQIPAYCVRIMKDENGITHKTFDGFFTIPKKGIRIRSDNTAKAAAKAEITNLLKFKTDGKITQETYDNLIAGTVSWGELIKDKQSPENGYYILRELVNGIAKYYIYNKFWGNMNYVQADNRSINIPYQKNKKGVEDKKKPLSNYWLGDSGLTVSFGYDMGGKDLATDYSLPSSNPMHDTTLTYITGFSNLTSLQELALKKGFGIKRAHAVALYYTFYDIFFNVKSVDFDYAVGHILPLKKKKYFALGISSKYGLRSGTENYFKIYSKIGSAEFYDNGGSQYLNEVEKILFGTQLFNAGEYSLQVKTSKNAKVLLHAFNTHDIRWAKYFFKSKTTVFRKAEIFAFLSTKIVFDHYDIKQQSL